MIARTAILLFFALCTLSSTSGLRQVRHVRFGTVRATMRMVASNKIDITGRGLEVTDTLRNRVENKIGKVHFAPRDSLLPFRPFTRNFCVLLTHAKVLNKLASPPGVVSSHLVLRVHKQKAEETHASTTKANSQIVELTVQLKGGQVIHTTERSGDMYQSIDVLSHKLAQKLKAAKDRLQDKRGNEKVGGNVSEDEEGVGAFTDEELLMDIDNDYRTKYLGSIPPPLQAVDVAAIKKKVYDMKPIDLAQAVESLYYIDHPFFVFRNKATNEVNVVYRKEDGGVGHIAPEP